MDKMCHKNITSMAASYPRWSEGAPGNMKYKAPEMVAIFFMTNFNRDRGGDMAPLAPSGSAAVWL